MSESEFAAQQAEFTAQQAEFVVECADPSAAKQVLSVFNKGMVEYDTKHNSLICKIQAKSAKDTNKIRHAVMNQIQLLIDTMARFRNK